MLNNQTTGFLTIGVWQDRDRRRLRKRFECWFLWLKNWKKFIRWFTCQRHDYNKATEKGGGSQKRNGLSKHSNRCIQGSWRRNDEIVPGGIKRIRVDKWGRELRIVKGYTRWHVWSLISQ